MANQSNKWQSSRRALLTKGALVAPAVATAFSLISGSARASDSSAPSASGWLSHVKGFVAPGYEAVRDAFAENLATGQELGGAFAVFRNGKAVVDIWGGVAAKDRSAEISANSLFTVNSSTKGPVSICIAKLVEQGKLDYEAPVSAYWPEFAKHGKDKITVGELMSHQAGLVAPRMEATIQDFYAHDRIAAALAAQEPYFRPGVWGYHPLTFGTLADELVRRVDGRSVNRFFAEEFGQKFGDDLFLGLPENEDHRHVGMTGSPESKTQFYDSPIPDALHDSMTRPFNDWTWGNQRDFRKFSQPGAGASANARGLSKLYASLVCDPQQAEPLLTARVFNEATRERVSGIDRCSGGIARYAAGFRLNVGTFGSNPDSFGHPGMGGSVGFADPKRRLGVGYTTCRMLNPSWQALDPRLGRLLNAFYAAESSANPSG